MKRTTFTRRFLAVVFVIALMVSMVGPAAADAADTFVLDHFDTFQSLSFALPITSSATSIADAEVLGGERDLYGVITGGPAGELLNITVNNASNSRVAVTSGVDLLYRAQIQYDGSADTNKGDIDYTGLGNTDLTAGNTRDLLVIAVPFSDHNTPVYVYFYSSATSCTRKTVTVTSVNSLNPKLFELTLATTGNGAVICPGFSSHATFSSIGAVVVEISAISAPTASTDMAFHIVATTREAYKDYGDLPNDGGTYTFDYDDTLVTEPNVHARHMILGSYLGSTVTPSVSEEVSKRGEPVNANADTLDDGVTRTGNWTSGAGGGPLQVVVSNCTGTCYLTAFIDWNQDGNFWDENVADWDTNERIFADQTVTNGANNFNIAVPVDVASGSFHARFRITDHNNNGLGSAWGSYTSGEVEDYYWTFGPLAVTLDSLSARSAQNGTALLILGTTVALGAVGVIALRRRK